MKKLSLIIAAVFIFGVGNFVKADDKEAKHEVTIGISTHALMDIESESGLYIIELSPSAPAEAGLGLNYSNLTNDDLWLNYSSIVSKKNNENSISAKVNNLPNGVILELEVKDADETKGKGKIGKSETKSSAIELDGNGKKVVDKIGSCYTGNNYGSGHNLVYSLKLDESKYSEIVATSDSDAPIEVVYTITEK